MLGGPCSLKDNPVLKVLILDAKIMNSWSHGIISLQNQIIPGEKNSGIRNEYLSSL